MLLLSNWIRALCICSETLYHFSASNRQAFVANERRWHTRLWSFCVRRVKALSKCSKALLERTLLVGKVQVPPGDPLSKTLDNCCHCQLVQATLGCIAKLSDLIGGSFSYVPMREER